jgi:anti-sigma B factor antagonist
MKIKKEKIKDFILITPEEERIDAHNSTEFKEYILDLLKKGKINLIVQLGQVRFIDSSGLGALLAGFKNAQRKSGNLLLVNVQPQVLSMFEMTRLNRVFEIYSDLDEIFDSEP